MANITVSANVDTMLQAANNAAIRTAIGAGDVTLAGTQTITGAKTFSDDLILAGASKLGIGTASPGSLLTLSADAAHEIQLNRTGANPGVCKIENSGNLLVLSNNVTGIDLKTGSTLATRIRISSGGDVGIGTTSPDEKIDVVGAGRFSTGVTFGTDTAAANKLDDYEEGSWTPTVLFGGASVSVTYDAQVGRYTKIGNSVSASCFMDLSSKGSSTGSAVLGGLPFTSLNVASNNVATTLRLQSISFADVPMAYLTPNSTVVQLQESNNAGVVTTLTDGNFVDSSTVMVSVTYRV